LQEALGKPPKLVLCWSSSAFTSTLEGAAVHSTLQAGAYDAVNELLRQATSRAEAIDALTFIRGELLSGGFPSVDELRERRDGNGVRANVGRGVPMGVAGRRQ
jgi:hypothetical protein